MNTFLMSLIIITSANKMLEFDLGAQAGLSYQHRVWTCLCPPEYEKGWSAHSGAIIGVGFRLPAVTVKRKNSSHPADSVNVGLSQGMVHEELGRRIPVTLGLQAGVVYYPALYKEVVSVYPFPDSVLVSHLLYNNLLLPLLVRAEFQTRENLRLGFGAGICLPKTLSCFTWWRGYPTSWREWDVDSLMPYRNLEVKADAAFRIRGNLWLRPALTCLVEKSKPYPGWLDVVPYKGALFFSMELDWKP